MAGASLPRHAMPCMHVALMSGVEWLHANHHAPCAQAAHHAFHARNCCSPTAPRAMGAARSRWSSTCRCAAALCATRALACVCLGCLGVPPRASLHACTRPAGGALLIPMQAGCQPAGRPLGPSFPHAERRPARCAKPHGSMHACRMRVNRTSFLSQPAPNCGSASGKAAQRQGPCSFQRQLVAVNPQLSGRKRTCKP